MMIQYTDFKHFPRKAKTLMAGVMLAASAAASNFSAAQDNQDWSVEWGCPAGFDVQEGLNTNFPHKGLNRAFVVHAPEASTGPLPVWVPLTGSVESTNANLTVPRSGANATLAEHGFMVIGPVRACANQDPQFGGTAQQCNRAGSNGWNWDPWFEGRAASAAGDQWQQDAGPDASFLEAVVQCVGTRWPLDSRRLYLGGISSGGTMTNRALSFGSGFWAGGLPISGEWYVTRDDGTPLSFDAARQAVIDQPQKIHQGRVGPYPLKTELDPMIVMTVWGGDNDIWYCGSGDSRFLCADYRPSTQAGSRYFSSLEKVVHVACKAGHGHMWPQVNTQAFNVWALTTLASFPKGSNSEDFILTTPPEGYDCQVGPFTDLY
jgi:poly(3-hydroxybutyrate) depolymerase